MRARLGFLRSVPLLVLFSGMFPSAGGVFADEFRSTWHNDLDRTWVGRDYHANRWQDWRVENGRLECLESGKRLPMRTVQVLPEVLDPMKGRADLSVGLGEIEFEAACADNQRASAHIPCANTRDTANNGCLFRTTNRNRDFGVATSF